MAVQLHHQPNLLYTCRYWALGPKCPNVDALGTAACPFAHHDTGRLASEILQKGTCLSWKRFGFCRRGAGCWYEHRDTGVTGLHQGTIDLTGFELEVADAAFNAGFNTSNHHLLFSLIWSVKRLAIRTGGLDLRSLPRPPRDPIYPDRYRPSGIGDNTKKKRRPVVIRPPRDHTVELKFHPIKPLMRKRPLDGLQPEAQANVIDLTGDSDDEDLIELTSPPSAVHKRQKTTVAVDIKPSMQHIHGPSEYLPGGTMPKVLSTTLTKGQRKCESRRRNKAAQATSILPASRQQFKNTNAVSVPPSKPMTEVEEITKQLLLVKSKLDDARKNMNTCQATMKTLFDTHYNMFDNEEMMQVLQSLSNHMNKVFDGSKDGAGDLERAIVILTTSEDKIL